MIYTIELNLQTVDKGLQYLYTDKTGSIREVKCYFLNDSPDIADYEEMFDGTLRSGGYYRDAFKIETEILTVDAAGSLWEFLKRLAKSNNAYFTMPSDTYDKNDMRLFGSVAQRWHACIVNNLSYTTGIQQQISFDVSLKRLNT